MKSIVNLGVFLLLLLTISSCEKFLELPPKDAISNDDYWKSSADLEKYILQFYPKLPRHSTAGTMPMEDASSDNLILAVPDLVLNGGRTVTTGSWSSDWTNIRDINFFFDNYGKVQDRLENYRHFLGEAHFFKAWFYFQLLNQYGDVPWYTSALLPGSEELHIPRTPRNVVADSILAHVDKAIGYLNPRSAAGNTRINKEAALAFKTRVALYEGTWQKYHQGTPFATSGAQPEKYFQACVDAAKQLMDGNYVRGIYSTGNPDVDYYTLFGMDNMSNINEVLLYSASNAAENMGNNVQLYTTVRSQRLAVTWNLVTSYLGKTGLPYNYLATAKGVKGNDFLRKIAADCDPRLHATVWIPGDLRIAGNNSRFDKPFVDQGGENLCATGFQVKKFSNPYSRAAGSDQSGGFSETGYIIFRFAEVLLNLAEAQYELDQTVAYDALNLLRRRAGMPDFKVLPQSGDPNAESYGYPVADALYEIRRERRVELALEGRRPDDYRRWAAHELFRGKRFYGYPFLKSEFPSYNPPLQGDGLIDYFRSQLPDGYRFRPERDYLDDIPQLERTLNPNLSQNPGW
ncbi:RagB/SusD family nutrient uptake outer membrane protein [Ravibacter arvi]|uniref:RagB/SusD family nutrient uptake outer membrane protein n=1 Tax=Ravibacter arvi TaxID=2051041 RepID=A0ABP8LNC6_9BACT